MIVGIVLFRFERFRDRVIQALHNSNEDLEKEIEERILAEDRLIESKEQMRRLGNQLQIVREEEKTHIAREVHDELGQTLTALKMELSCLRYDLNAGSGEAQSRIGTMSKLIDNTIQSFSLMILKVNDHWRHTAIGIHQTTWRSLNRRVDDCLTAR